MQLHKHFPHSATGAREEKHQQNPERRSAAPHVSFQGIVSGGWTQ